MPYIAPMLPVQRAKHIIELCRAERFALAGVCEAQPSDHPDALREWLAAGKHGSMTYLENHTDIRIDPRLLLDDARSVIMVADQYDTRTGPSATHEAIPEGHGRIARYARGDDYHASIKKRLHRICDLLRETFPDDAFRAFVDTAPILEREHAARAGLGWIGKHTLLIHPRRGSYLFLGGIITTLELESPVHQSVIPDHCGTCTRCIDACPTQAITPYSVDASRCISYLTIERREPIDAQFHEAIDDMIFGCDICQEVCPHNAPTAVGQRIRLLHDTYAPRHSSLPLNDVVQWTSDDRSRAFRKSAMKRATLDMMKRNASIALGNSEEIEP